MARRSAFHLNPHRAFPLIAPLAATLTQLESRTRHHLEVVKLDAAGRAALSKAEQALARARGEIERLCDESRGQR